MTTVQHMLDTSAVNQRILGALRLGAAATLAAAIALTSSGCASNRDVLTQPKVLVSPYLPARTNVLWAVAPLYNESGVSGIDTIRIGDMLVAAISEADGLSAVPMNRTLSAMAAKGLGAIRSPRDAKLVAEALGVDGIVVGSVTAWDPYEPPKLGLSLIVYTVESKNRDEGVDPRALSGAYTDQHGKNKLGVSGDRPASSVVEHLDAANHEILMEVKAFAEGRHDPSSALSWKRYTASMELYSEFAAYHTVRRLLEEERIRVGGHVVAGAEGKDKR